MIAVQTIIAALFMGWTLVDVMIAVVIIAACVALVYIALRQFGVSIPPWFVQVLWIMAVAFVVIIAIRIVASM